MIHWITTAVVIVTLVTATDRVWADAEDCQNAVDTYNSITGDISDTLKHYADCVGSSRGRDDCDYEFRKLKSAQDDFESAVSNYRSDCD